MGAPDPLPGNYFKYCEFNKNADYYGVNQFDTLVMFPDQQHQATRETSLNLNLTRSRLYMIHSIYEVTNVRILPSIHHIHLTMDILERIPDYLTYPAIISTYTTWQRPVTIFNFIPD